jgi:hypothetical protein
MAMQCQQVKWMLSVFEDGVTLDGERLEILAHLSQCHDCATHAGQLRGVRHSLKNLREADLPSHLEFALLSLASRESARKRRHLNFRATLRATAETLSLTVNNMMKPLALPAAGGLASAVVLFCMVMFNFQGIVTTPQPNDIPIVLTTYASVQSTFLGFNGDELIVDVLVDEGGRVIDYTIPESPLHPRPPDARRDLEHSLLFTIFKPATSFGQPIAGWVRLSLRRIETNVKG